MISNASDLLARLCNDTNAEDGLLRLVPDKGKTLVEFKSKRGFAWYGSEDCELGNKGSRPSKYANAVAGDLVQTFRNFANSVVDHNNTMFSKRDGVLILLDEFDVIKDKSGLGSLIKSLSSDRIKFGICGIGQDLSSLIADHASVGRLIEQGAIFVSPMSYGETTEIFAVATKLFSGKVDFTTEVVEQISILSEGYPYFAHLIGKACVTEANFLGTNHIDSGVLSAVTDKIASGQAFPEFGGRLPEGDRAI